MQFISTQRQLAFGLMTNISFLFHHSSKTASAGRSTQEPLEGETLLVSGTSF